MVQPSSNDRQIPTIDFGPYLQSDDKATRQKVASQLAQVIHEWGCCGIVNHGLAPATLEAAFDMSQRLFGLPMEDKMKAPHPDSLMPHRGYCKPGMEKSYAKELVEAGTEESRKTVSAFDYKEHYEIGHEDNPQGNIWLPDSVLPGFRDFEVRLHAELAAVVDQLLEALLLGLEVSKEEASKFHSQHSASDNHLRLLHYPPIAPDRDRAGLGRAQAHEDYGSLTILFQDNSANGLEFEDRKAPGTFVPAIPSKGRLYLNIGDMLEIFTKGYYPAALHRVVVPTDEHEAARSRYSIPYFAQPRLDERVELATTGLPGPLPQGRYRSETWEEHAALRMKWQFEGDGTAYKAGN